MIIGAGAAVFLHQVYEAQDVSIDMYLTNREKRLRNRVLLVNQRRA